MILALGADLGEAEKLLTFQSVFDFLKSNTTLRPVI
jgi:hypothetical protein